MYNKTNIKWNIFAIKQNINSNNNTIASPTLYNIKINQQ
jgi:hypothetical protein